MTWGCKGGMGKRDVGTHRDEDQRVSSDAGGRGDAGKANELLVKKKKRRKKKAYRRDTGGMSTQRQVRCTKQEAGTAQREL